MTSLLPQRKGLRLRQYDYAQAGMYFVTVCTQDRACVFGSVAGNEMRLDELGCLIEASWRALPTQFSNMTLDEFVVMPNHFHGLVVLEGEKGPGAMNRAPTLGEVVRSFKARCTRSCRGAIHGARGVSLWQRDYYEHVIRNEQDLSRIREYIRNNPAQWALDRNNPAWDGRDKSRPYGL